ncbi:MAG: hypothetical protein HZB62_07680 [Nitrospirae bacterium]|nr:hypothetical protein [Nitrospirota bacterium]
MKKTLLILLGIGVIFVLWKPSVYALPEAKITVQIVDEESVPMSSIDMGITFSRVKNKNFDGKSDSSGKFTASADTDGRASYGASKPGYYDSHGSFDFVKVEGSKWIPMSYKWLPWNPEIKLVLRKIRNPVPMYARDTQMSGLRLPAAGKEAGFDLMEYSWMPPYGKGKHADFIFKLDETYTGEGDFISTLIISFPNKFDGIQMVNEDLRNGSIFKLPRFAPEDGYQSIFKRVMRKIPGKPLERDFDNGNSYIFRVRSEMKDNKLIRAMYGKIQGDIGFDPAFQKTIDLRFTYYLNPDYTRNLEYDRTRNLFGKLPSLERVDQ